MKAVDFKYHDTALTYDDIQLVPMYSDVRSRVDVNTSTCIDAAREIYLDVPIIAAPMDTVCDEEMAIALWKLGGLGIVHRFMSVEEMIEKANRIKRECGFVALSVGVGKQGRKRFSKVNREVAVDLWCVDIAHGHHILMKEYLQWARPKYNGHIMAGNVATAVGVDALSEWGADSVKVGIGGGSVCTTRNMTKVGVPQVTAVAACANNSESKTPIIADGGIRYPGDVASALALGASAVMIGGLLSGTKETPGDTHKQGSWPSEMLYKYYRGSASIDSKVDRGEETKNVEGASSTVPYKGKARRIVGDIMDGVRSSMSYLGARNITSFQTRAEFVRVTNAGVVEASPHGIK
jgi:IMP dehydrogenase